MDGALSGEEIPGGKNTGSRKLPAPGSQSPSLVNLTNFKTIRKAGREKEKDKRAACSGETACGRPGSGWTAGRPRGLQPRLEEP